MHLRAAAGGDEEQAQWRWLLTPVGAALAFGLAEPLGGSGFIAAFVAGVTFGGLCSPRRDADQPLPAQDLGALLNALTFLAFGAAFMKPLIERLDRLARAQCRAAQRSLRAPAAATATADRRRGGHDECARAGRGRSLALDPRGSGDGVTRRCRAQAQPARGHGDKSRVSREADRRRAGARLAVLGLAIAVAFLAVTLAGIAPSDARRWVAGAGPAGPVVFVLTAGALGVALFPGHVTATVAGMLFGAIAGTGLALAATLLGAATCLLAARRFGAEAVVSLLGSRGRRWRAWLAANGFSAVLASRLAPGTPAGMINYLAGLAGIPARAFFPAVALGALPKTIAYVALGGALSDPLSTRGAFAVAIYLGAAVVGALIARRLLGSRPAPAAA